MLTGPDEIRRIALDANSGDNVIGVIAWMHTFSPAKMWIGGLSALDKPLLHLHTQANVTLPWSTIDMDFMNLNQAAHGDREFGYIQTRLALRRKTVVGHVSDPRVTGEVATWMRAAAGWAATRSLKLARFGDNMRFVAVTEGDKTEAEAVFGVQVNTWGVNDLVAAVADVAPADVDTLVEEYEETYDVVPELRSGKDRHQSLRDGAAIELGLRSFLSGGGFGAFTTNFEDLGGLKQLPGLAVQRLMADGYGFGAEGDWKTAVLVRAAKVMGAGLPGGASLMEDYTYDLTPGNERILGAHMLEVCPTLTVSRPRLEIHPLSIGGREDPVRLVFSADPGPGVVIALSDMRDRFRLVANVVEVVPPSEPLPRLPVGRAVWRPEPDFRTSATAWLEAGAAHHTVHVHRGGHRGLPGLRPDGRHGTAHDRLGDDGAGVRERAPLERRLLPAGARHLKCQKLVISKRRTARKTLQPPFITRLTRREKTVSASTHNSLITQTCGYWCTF